MECATEQADPPIPLESQLDSAFQPYRGRLKGLQGQWNKVKERGSWKKETEEKGKDHQKKKNGRKKIRKKDRRVWKNQKRGKIRTRTISSTCKRRHKKMTPKVMLEKEPGKGKDTRESPKMIKVASEILMGMFKENNAGSIADALLGPSQVKILTLLCRKARTGETAYRAAHSPSPVFGCGLWQTKRIRRRSTSTAAFSTAAAGEFRSCGKEELQMQDEAVHLSRQPQVHVDSMLCTQSSCLTLPYNASHKPSMGVDSANRIVK